MNATIIQLNGNRLTLHEWQSQYGLIVGSADIGRYMTIGEPNVNDGLEISEIVIRFFDCLRAMWGKPLYINSLDRTNAQQEQMKLTNPNAANTSPHVVKLAIDIDTISKEQTFDLLDCIDEVAKILGYQIRVGWKQYLQRGDTFIHVDVCPMYFSKGKIWHSKEHPKVWELQNEW